MLKSAKTVLSKRASSNFVKIVEVGPRDGLQNEQKSVPTEVKIELIDKLVESGLKFIEATAFVSPKWVPQMADQNEVMISINTKTYYSKNEINDENKEKLTFSALTPNLKGYMSAYKSGVNEVAVFGAASEAFSKKNINCSIEESLSRFKPVIQQALSDNIKVRGYVSCIAGCPIQGEVPIKDVVKISLLLYEAGCYEISLGDTIGIGTPKRIVNVLKELISAGIPIEVLALHCHDTYGQGIANCYAGLQNGIRIFDGAVSGLGGCPYAKGASGNVATEDLVYMLHGNGMLTGIDIDKLAKAGTYISDYLDRDNGSKVGNLKMNLK